jgi:multiple sugar transport system substrate-binding protein
MDELNPLETKEEKPLMAGQGAPLFPQPTKSEAELFQKGGPPVPPPPIGAAPPPPLGNAQTPPTSSGSGKGSMKKILVIVVVVVGLLLSALLAVSFFLNREKAVPQKDEVELTWWGLWEDPSIVKPLIDEYEAAHPKTKIKYERQSKEDYRERLTSALASGQGPDIFRLHNTWVPMFVKDLTPIPASTMTPQEFVNTFYPVAVTDLTISTGIVGIPLEFDGLAMFINEDLFTTFALTPPKTWDEFRTTATALTIIENRIVKQAGAAIGLTENVDHWEDILGLLYLQNGANPAMPGDERSKKTLEFYANLASEDKVWDAALPPSTVAFAGGKVAMYFGPSWRIFDIQKLNPSLKFKVVPVPQLSKPETDPNITYASYWFEGVSNKSPGQSQAWDFLKFMSSKESLEKLYKNAAATRAFGEPYGRPDMRELLLADPYTGPFLEYAPNAKSWYLASRTFDGETGINSQLSKYFSDALDKVSKGDSGRSVTTLDSGVAQVMKQYGIKTK